MGFIMFLLALPFELLRGYIFQPVVDRTQSTYDEYKTRTKQGVVTVREVLVKFAILGLAAAVIIWLAVFMYIAFYYTYMPAIAHIRPVHMQFKTCEGEIGPCTFPRAHVLLTKKQQLLMVGQPYRISVNIVMPESEQNLELGMFMVCAEMRDQNTQLRNHACRSAMLHYRSKLARTISTLIMSPLIVLGFKEETQHVPVEIFSSYEDDQENPVTDVFVEIESRQIQFYSVTLHITAHFSGLRYIMFHWPTLSASIGIGANLFFILTVSILSWYHWSDSVWVEETRQRIRNRAEQSRQKRAERSSTHSSVDISPLSTSNDESNKAFEDDEEDISIIDEKMLQKLSGGDDAKENDEDDGIEELSGVSGSGGARQRKPLPKSIDVETTTGELHAESSC